MKRGLYLGVFLSLLPSVAAFGPADVGNVLMNWFTTVGSLGFINDTSLVHALIRILVWLLVMTLIFALLIALGGGGDNGGDGGGPFNFLSRRHSVVVAFILATISAIFIPVNVLLAIGSGYATIFALILIGGPIVGLGVLFYTFPQGGDTRASIFIKIVLILVLMWILAVMRESLASNFGGLI